MRSKHRYRAKLTCLRKSERRLRAGSDVKAPGMCASALPQENGGLENGKSSTERSTEEGEGLTQLESLCMECRENVRIKQSISLQSARQSWWMTRPGMCRARQQFS